VDEGIDGVNSGSRPVPGFIIKRKLDILLNYVAPEKKKEIFKGMEKAGIRLDDESACYSLKQIRDYFSSVFGENAARLLVDVLRNTLQKDANSAFKKQEEKNGSKSRNGNGKGNGDKDKDKDGKINGRPDLLKLINQAIEDKARVNRRYIDEILEQIQDRNHEYFASKFIAELEAAVEEEKKGNVRQAVHHRTMANVYKSIIDQCFT
jgi:hypothetical protein